MDNSVTKQDLEDLMDSVETMNRRHKETIQEIQLQIQRHEELLHEIKRNMALLKELADSLRALRLIGKAILWVGGLAAAVLATLEFWKGIK